MNYNGNRIVKVFFLLILFFVGVISTAWSAQTDYDGLYAGTFTGDDNGIWVANIKSSSDSVFLSLSTDSNQADGSYLDWWNESGSIGLYYSIYTEINGSYVYAYIDSSDGSVSGDWGNTTSDDTGYINGSKVNATAFVGTYSGTYTGDDSGTWSMTITSDGKITGSTMFDYGSNNFEGGCHPDGYVFAIGEDVANGNIFGFFGQISDTKVSGSWISDSGDSGTFSTDANGNGDTTDIIQVAGKWQVTDVNDERGCEDGGIRTVVYTIDVQQDGDQVTVTKEPEGTFTGKISGNTITWSGSYPEEGGTTTISSMTVTVSNDGKSFTSQSNWTWTDGTYTCGGSSQGEGVLTLEEIEKIDGNVSSSDGGGGGGCFIKLLKFWAF